MHNNTIDRVWLQTIETVLHFGKLVKPRGKPTNEILHHTVTCDMRFPVLTHPDRSLSYQFMTAEAFWILSGDNTVAGIAPYNKHISQFSDDGVKFFGAYGPKIADQLPYLVNTLRSDPDSRQAGLTTWRENPPQTKDVPCTIAIFANIREAHLNVHVFMRSSDVWLGLPYDIFNFSMLGHLICCHLNHANVLHSGHMVQPGLLFLTAASTHLYHTDLEKAQKLDMRYQGAVRLTPMGLHLSDVMLFDTLRGLRESAKGDPRRWWELEVPSATHV